MALKRANTSSWSTEGGGVTNNSPRTSSYLLPSSGSRWSSSSVHALAGIDIAMETLSSRNRRDACAEDTQRRRTRPHRITPSRCGRRHLHGTLGGRAESRRQHRYVHFDPFCANARPSDARDGPPLHLASLQEPSALEYRGHSLFDSRRPRRRLLGRGNVV